MSGNGCDGGGRSRKRLEAGHVRPDCLVVQGDPGRCRRRSPRPTYFLWRLFGAQCSFVAELTGLLTWYEANQVTFDGQVKNSHDDTAFVADVSWVLGQYLNSCVVASTTAGLYAPGSRNPVSLALILQELSWGT